jgi:hypothetical protein
MNENAFYKVDTPTLWERLMRRLFPAKAVQPFDPMPGFAAGDMISNVRVRLDMRDRLRVLISGRIAVDIRHATDVEVGRIVSRSEFYVLAPGSWD